MTPARVLRFARSARGRLGALAVAVPMGLALTGCGGDPSPSYAQAFGFHCDRHADLPSRVACARIGDERGAEVSRYCYKTLADANCFDRPDPDTKNQALGSSGY